ncbi:hypothetical protein [Photobacterium aquimaris]|uniref:hypothetical protein n=1 Tax=Photobacterium aquimaris TaxID=512643 RepID=UPI00076A9D31|nr:hypothetical protein [Photobacterium aquimaris]OBU19891.1 hypothetical protein AYY21_18435 [Photobacterium aquimaris]PQJ38415.1 hypothetical protein BTN98_13395 [Photobacterium aquimaris]
MTHTHSNTVALDATVLIGMFARRLFLKSTVATMVATYLTGCNSSSSNSNDDKDNTHQNWKLVILPDTQKYSENSPERYLSQTQWTYLAPPQIPLTQFYVAITI